MNYREICEKNINLVYMVANRFNTRFNKDDLISEGMIGLLYGAKTYDKTRGCQLSTYLTECIKNNIYKFIRQENREKRKANYDNVSLNMIICDDMELQDVIKSDYDLEKIMEDKLKYEYLISLFDNLTTKQAFILRELFINEKTTKEIAEELNVSLSQVSHYKNKAINRLRYFINKEKKYEL